MIEQNMTRPRRRQLQVRSSPATRRLWVLAAAATLLVAPGALAKEPAQPPAIIGDRPDFTESAATVPRAHLQGELGVAYSTIGRGELLTVPNLLLRYGLLDQLEARLGLPSLETSFAEGQRDSEPGGFELGLKTTLAVGGKGALGILPFLALPVQREHWSAAGMTVGLKALWAVDFTDVLSLGGNLGVILENVAAEQAELAPRYLASASLGLSILCWLGTFAELYGVLDNDANLALVADTGLTFLVAPWLQLDLHVGLGVTEEAEGFELGAGAVFLL